MSNSFQRVLTTISLFPIESLCVLLRTISSIRGAVQLTCLSPWCVRISEWSATSFLIILPTYQLDLCFSHLVHKSYHESREVKLWRLNSKSINSISNLVLNGAKWNIQPFISTSDLHSSKLHLVKQNFNYCLIPTGWIDFSKCERKTIIGRIGEFYRYDTLRYRIHILRTTTNCDIITSLPLPRDFPSHNNFIVTRIRPSHGVQQTRNKVIARFTGKKQCRWPGCAACYRSRAAVPHKSD